MIAKGKFILTYLSLNGEVMKEKLYLLNLFKEKFNINLTLYENGKHLFSTAEELAGDNFSFEREYDGATYKIVLQSNADNQKYVDFLEILLFGDEQLPVKDKADAVIKTLNGVILDDETYLKYGLMQKNCIVLIIEGENLEGIIPFLSFYNPQSYSVMKDGYCVVTLFSSVKDDYASVGKYASVLREAIKEELSVYVKIGYGGAVESFKEVELSYKQALLAIKQGKLFSDKNVYSYPEYLPIKILKNISNTEKNALLKSYKYVLDDEELSSTANEFLNCDLNVRMASKRLFIHRNTLYYRLAKIEEITGLDVKKFSDAMTFRLLSLLSKIKENDYE